VEQRENIDVVPGFSARAVYKMIKTMRLFLGDKKQEKNKHREEYESEKASAETRSIFPSLVEIEILKDTTKDTI